MNWYDSVFEVIDMRSFSNLWYWIGLAVLWSSVSHWVLGVPHDMILRARREKEGQAMDDLHDLVRVNVNRILFIAEVDLWVAIDFDILESSPTHLKAAARGVPVEERPALFYGMLLLLLQ